MLNRETWTNLATTILRTKAPDKYDQVERIRTARDVFYRPFTGGKEAGTAIRP